MKLCKVCGWRKATRKGRCESCYRFYRRHSRDKTTEEVMRAYERVLDKMARVLAS